ncbi:phage tail fiber protein [Asticcacaulis sp.]|uniref:phage tail fiber protein n=1 Tax=Asticcacaulis sp. TaxID=1872648 RepID=UPI003F7BF215
MPGFSDYLEDKITDWLTGTDMPAAPAALYIALFNGDPTDAGTGGTDVTTDIRAAGRVAAAFDKAGGSMTSNAVVTFGPADTGPVTFTHFAVYDAAADGHMLGSNALAGGSKTVSADTEVFFDVGDLTWTID